MKMSSQMVERTLSHFEAQPVPDDHPAVTQLNRLFGDHTFFLDGTGLLIGAGRAKRKRAQSGVVVKLASWSDSARTSLAPHPPEVTDHIILLEAA